MAERMNFEEFCNRVVQEINQEKALGESVASYEDKKIRVMERKNVRSVSTGLEPKGCYDWYAATGDFTRAYADIKENLRTAMEEFHEKVGETGQGINRRKSAFSVGKYGKNRRNTEPHAAPGYGGYVSSLLLAGGR